MRTAAFFDFDGTVIDGYSALALIKSRARELDIGPTEAVRLLTTIVENLAGRAEAEDLMRVGVETFRGRPLAELDEMGARLARTLSAAVHPGAAERIAWHQQRGHLVVIASSALPFQVEPLAAELGIDAVLCSRVESVDGVCTGALDGPMLWAKEKALAVQRFATLEDIDLEASYAYANGDEDVDFLASVGHPHAVNADADLAVEAEARGWPVLSFRGASGSALDLPRTLAAYGGLAAASLVGAGLGLVNRSRRVAANTSLSLGSQVALSLAGVQVRCAGEHHLWEHRPAVFLFNHQSLLDPLVVFSLVQRDVTAVGKKEVSSQPGVGQFAWLINAALVDRADVSQAKVALQPAVDRLRDGYSVVIAPEGTRSLTSRVGEFKKGPFHLAIQGGVPVVPVVLRNTGDLQHRSSRSIRSGVVDALVLPPVSVADWDPADLGPRVAAVRQLYVDALADWDAAVTRATSSDPKGRPVRKV